MIHTQFYFVTAASSKELCLFGNIYNNNLTLTGLNGTLQSPKEGSSYPPYLNCDWFITVPEGNIVKLYFDSFDLDWSSGCVGDYLEVINGNSSNNNSIGRFCGSGRYAHPESIRSSGRYMLVRFRSDGVSAGPQGGFKLTFIADDESSKLESLNNMFFVLFLMLHSTTEHFYTHLWEARPIENIIQSNLRLRPPLVSNCLSSAASLPKYQKFPSQIYIDIIWNLL